MGVGVYVCVYVWECGRGERGVGVCMCMCTYGCGKWYACDVCIYVNVCGYVGEGERERMGGKR